MKRKLRIRPRLSEEISIEMQYVQNGPLLSILIPVYNTPKSFLIPCLESVKNQKYTNWECIIIDDDSDKSYIQNILSSYAKADTRFQVYKTKKNQGISQALNLGLKKIKGSFVTVLDHDDLFDLASLYWIARTILENPKVDYIYTDEDKLSESNYRIHPSYKPDWSPEYILACMYICHMSVFRTKIVKELGGFRSEYDGAQDYDLLLRVLLQTNHIHHIPKILYHWRMWKNSPSTGIKAKPYALKCQEKAIKEYLRAKEESFQIQASPNIEGCHRVTFFPKEKSLISIVIPTANKLVKRGKTHIDALIESIFQKTQYKNYEIILVHDDNFSMEQKNFFDQEKKICLVHYNFPSFSYSKKVNMGVKASKGEYILLLNDDTRVISENWLEKMLGMVQRKKVGAVAPKLLFPNNTIQHAGVILANGLPGHPYYGTLKETSGYMGSIQLDRNYLAVTGACMMTPRFLYEKVGGYSERYPLDYNDIDYCLRLHELGYRSVYLASLELYHYEGSSRKKKNVSQIDMETFLEDWQKKYPIDPYYSPNLSQNSLYKDLGS